MDRARERRLKATGKWFKSDKKKQKLMGKPYLSCIISGWFYFLYYKFIDEDSAMNLLAEEIRELIKERYYEYLEEGYPSFEAMELAKKDVYEAKDSEIGAFDNLYGSSIEVD